MVDTLQPRVLVSFRNRIGVVATNEHAAAEMEQSKTPNHRARHKTRASLLSDKGLDAANHNRASGGGRRMFLTSPLIEQAITLTFRRVEHNAIKQEVSETEQNEHAALLART